MQGTPVATHPTPSVDDGATESANSHGQPAGSHRIADSLPMSSWVGPIVASATRADSYPVEIVSSQGAAIEALAGIVGDHRAFVITDQTVLRTHAQQLVGALAGLGIPSLLCCMKDGERSKQLGTAYALLDWLAASDMHRRDVVLAVGGGVVCDTAGWVASAYMRGVPYVNVPTTLMAQVDAALGGKVGVDHGSAKNLVGAFHLPLAVVTCPAFLDTLGPRHMRNGLAEVVKKAIIASPELFGYLERCWPGIVERQQPVLREVIPAATRIKLALIGRDPYERDLRRALNFGHTVGHAVETVTGYGPVLHGEGVALGMAVAVRIAVARGVLAEGPACRMLSLLSDMGLPVELDQLPVAVDVDALARALEKIRQIRGGSLNYVMPAELGVVEICDDIDSAEVAAALYQPDEFRTAI